MKGKVHSAIAVVMLIIACGGLLRIWDVATHAFSGDEIFTLRTALFGVKEIIHRSRYIDLHPPALYLALRPWIAVFGESELALRMFAVIWGILLIPLVYKFTAELFGRHTGLFAALLTATSPFLILYSRTGRWHQMVAFLDIAILYCFFRALKKDTLKSWLCLAAMSTIALYTGYHAVLIVFAEALVLLVFLKTHRHLIGKWIVCHLAIGLAYLPWIGFCIGHLMRLAAVGGDFSVRHGLVMRLLYIFLSFGTGHTVYPWHYVITIPANVILVTLCVVGLRHCRKTGQAHRCLFVVLPLFVVVITGSLSKTSLPHYFPSAAVLYYILVAVGLSVIKRGRAMAGVLALVLFFNAYALNNMYTDKGYHRGEFLDSWRLMASYLTRKLAPHDVVVCYLEPFAYYYEKAGGPRDRLLYLSVADQEKVYDRILDLSRNKKMKRLWFVDTTLSGGGDYRIRTFGGGAFRQWLIDHGFTVRHIKPFDRDEAALHKARYVARPFPEFRTHILLYDFPKETVIPAK